MPNMYIVCRKPDAPYFMRRFGFIRPTTVPPMLYSPSGGAFLSRVVPAYSRACFSDLYDVPGNFYAMIYSEAAAVLHLVYIKYGQNSLHCSLNNGGYPVVVANPLTLAEIRNAHRVGAAHQSFHDFIYQSRHDPTPSPGLFHLERDTATNPVWTSVAASTTTYTSNELL